MEPRDVVDDDRSGAIIATAAVCLAVATIMVSVRLYTRLCLVRQVGADDYLATVTLVLIYGVGIGMALNTRNGFGRHISMLDDDQTLLYKRSLYASIILYTTALLSVKTTLLAQYYRLFSVQSTRRLYIAAFTLVLLWSFSQVILATFVCTPVSAFWDDSSARGRCLPPMPLLYTNAAGNIATEIAILALPLPVLGTLNLPRSQRYMLIGIFSLGFLTVIISIIRIRHLNSLTDYTYQTIPAATLSLAELTAALTCACLLTLRPIITRAAPPSSPTSQYRHDYKRGSYLRHSDASTFARSASPSSSQRGSTPPRRGSAAVRYLASMESREGLYDDKYMLTASSFELENFPSLPQQAAILKPENTQILHRPLSSDSTPTRSITPHTITPLKKAKPSRWNRSMRSMTSSSHRKLKSAGSNREWDAESVHGGPTVKTEIDNRGAHKGKPTPKWEIGVTTTVSLTYQSTYVCTAVR